MIAKRAVLTDQEGCQLSGVMSRDRETDLLVHFKPPIGSQEDDRRRLHWVVCWQDNPSMIITIFESRVSRTSHCKVPFKQIVL